MLFFVLEVHKNHASRTRLGEARPAQYERVLRQTVPAQCEVYCQQQHVVGRARKVSTSGPRLVVREPVRRSHCTR